jgi:hypothetical protein
MCLSILGWRANVVSLEISTATQTDTATPSPTVSQTTTSTASETPPHISPPTASQTETLTATATVTQTAPPVVTTFQSSAAQDGWALESSETSNQGNSINATAATFNLGDTASRQQYRAILSFNTNALPDNAVVTGITLKIKKQGLTGMDPFTTHLRIAIDIRKGAFSNNTALQPTDFQAAANKPGVGLFANNPTAAGWYSARLTSAAYFYINRTGITQLRLRFQLDDDNDAVADFLRFYSGNAIAANRPILVIEYYVSSP